MGFTKKKDNLNKIYEGMLMDDSDYDPKKDALLQRYKKAKENYAKWRKVYDADKLNSSKIRMLKAKKDYLNLKDQLATRE